MRDGWKLGTLENVIASVRGGFSVKCEDRQAAPDEMAVLKTGAVLSGAFDLSQHKYVPPSEHSKLRTPVRAGTIVFCRKNSEDAVGAAALVNHDAPDTFLSDLLWELTPPEGVDLNWLINCLQSSRVRKLIQIEATGTQSTMRNISQDRLLGVPVDIPPLRDQRKIAEILRAWDEALEKLTALRAEKERRLHATVQRLLEPSRANGPDIAASNWSTSRLGDVFEERQDKNAGLDADDVVTVGKYAIRKQSEHFTRSVASKDLSNYWTISPGDFVYDPMSAYYGAIGRFSGTADGVVSPAYRVIRLRPGIDPDFMVALLRTHHIRFLLETRSSQGNKEGKRRLLQRDEFACIEFKLPSLNEQRAIAATISNFEADLELTRRKIEAVSRQKRGLMQKLLTGDWRVQP